MCKIMNLSLGGAKSEDEREEGNVAQVVEDEVLNPKQEQFFKATYKIEKRSKFDVTTISRNLNLEELIDWINEFEEYFECEYIEDPDQVKFVKAK